MDESQSQPEAVAVTPSYTFELGQATLQIGTTSNYWNEGGPHDKNLEFFRPNVGGVYWFLGDYATTHDYNWTPGGVAYVVSATGDDKGTPLIKPPIKGEFTKICSEDQNQGYTNKWSIWLPKPPDNYVSIGCIGGYGTEPPADLEKYNYGCLHFNLVNLTKAESLICRVKGYTSKKYISLYTILGLPNAFVAQAGTNSDKDPYIGAVYKPKGMPF